ncbi:hypothetical protein NODU109028_11770 [Nocardioides dubius]|uniref:DUF4232 domain-containing protein n=1 Tax=Nocardioides dubius TaxID=317019 RepID=A0ABP4EEV9_9ACTN
MSGVTRPSGPLPARVYWVRRALVLGTAFVLVFALARLLGGGSDGSSEATPQAEQAAAKPTSEVETAPKAETTPSAGQSGQAGKKTKKAKRSWPVADGDCLPEEVRVSPEIRSAAAGADRIRIPLTLTTDREACIFDFSASTVVLKITSGNDKIWSSQHCPTVLGERRVVVRSIRPVRLNVDWNGKRSNEECDPRTAGWAFKGGYHAIAAPLGGEPVDQYFELTQAESKVITKVREPKRKAKAKAGAEASVDAD